MAVALLVFAVTNSCAYTATIVNYEARALGVKRHMRGGEASKVCPSLQLVQVPTTHGKADITVYRKAGEEVVKVLSSLFRFAYMCHL